jgi:hypothetical protein
MDRKKGHVMKVTAAVIAAAVLVYNLLRYIGVDAVTNITDMATDKIANLFLPKSTQGRIYAAMLQRLERKFTTAQAKVLGTLGVQQCSYETSYNGVPFSSNVFRKYNNVCGYKVYKGSLYQDKAAGGMSPEGNAYGSYLEQGVEGCARELADWIGRRKESFLNVQNETQYAVAMKANDFMGQSATAYAAGMKTFKNLA